MNRIQDLLNQAEPITSGVSVESVRAMAVGRQRRRRAGSAAGVAAIAAAIVVPATTVHRESTAAVGPAALPPTQSAAPSESAAPGSFTSADIAVDVPAGWVTRRQVACPASYETVLAVIYPSPGNPCQTGGYQNAITVIHGEGSVASGTTSTFDGRPAILQYGTSDDLPMSPPGLKTETIQLPASGDVIYLQAGHGWTLEELAARVHVIAQPE